MLESQCMKRRNNQTATSKVRGFHMIWQFYLRFSSLFLTSCFAFTRFDVRQRSLNSFKSVFLEIWKILMMIGLLPCLLAILEIEKISFSIVEIFTLFYTKVQVNHLPAYLSRFKISRIIFLLVAS